MGDEDSIHDKPAVKPPRKAGLAHLLAATRYSLAGLKAAFRQEAAFRQDLLLVLLNTLGAFLVPMTPGCRVGIAALGFVLLAVELLNSAVESLADLISPQWNSLVKRAKDEGSAAIFCILSAMVIVWVYVLIRLC